MNICNGLVGLVAIALAGLAAGPAMALECPDKSSLGVAGPAPADLAEADAMVKSLSEARRSDNLAQIIAFLRAKAPAADPDKIANLLIAAYCPCVARRSDIDESAKTTTIRDFASDVTRLLY